MSITSYIIVISILIIIFWIIMFIKKNFLYYDYGIFSDKEMKSIKFPRILYILYFMMTFVPILNVLYLILFILVVPISFLTTTIRLEAKPEFKYKKYIDKLYLMYKKIETYLMKEF